IGANTAIFSVVHSLLLQPPPYADPDKLVILGEYRQGSRVSAAFANFKDWRERARSFSEMAAFRTVSFNLTGVDQPTRLSGREVNWNFFRILGVTPAIGRFFAESDDQANSSLSVVLNYGVWNDRFGRDPAIVGRTLLLDAKAHTVIGVAPPGFE